MQWSYKSTLKKIFFFVGVTGSVCAIAWYVFAVNETCYHDVVCRGFFERYAIVGDIFGTGVLLLPFSLITWFLNESIFKAWAWFAIVWMPILIIFPRFFDTQNNNFGPSDAFGVTFGLLVGYVIFSILIILIQSIRVYCGVWGQSRYFH